MATIEQLEVTPPHPQLLEIVNRVISQNDRIITMNERLLASLSSPVFIRRGLVDQKETKA